MVKVYSKDKYVFYCSARGMDADEDVADHIIKFSIDFS